MRRFRRLWERIGAHCCLFAVLVSMLVNCGCSTTTILPAVSHEELNARLKGQEVTIETMDGYAERVKDVHVSDTTVTWRHRNTGKEGRMKTMHLGRITMTLQTNHLLGAVHGLGIGAFGGFLLGGSLTGWRIPHDYHAFTFYEVGAMYGIVGGILGLIVGAAIGATHYEAYQFQ